MVVAWTTSREWYLLRYEDRHGSGVRAAIDRLSGDEVAPRKATDLCRRVNTCQPVDHLHWTYIEVVMQIERRVSLDPLDLALEMARIEPAERDFPNADRLGNERRDVDPKDRLRDHSLRD